MVELFCAKKDASLTGASDAVNDYVSFVNLLLIDLDQISDRIVESLQSCLIQCSTW
jgi:hypothetical protein